jgi:hypothetical protein
MNKMKPALLGGLVVGLLSAIPVLNYCCCIWGIVGGGLAGFLYIKDSPMPIRPGDGAMIGALAGVVGALIYLLVGVPIAYFFSAAAMEEAFTRSGVQLPVTGIALFIMSGLLGGLFLIILSVIGGLIAVPVFEKRKDAMPPPPPQDFPV